MVAREVSAAPLREGGAVVGLFGVAGPASTTTERPDATDLPLTERHLEVLQLLAEGKSTQHIADELVLTRVQAVIAASRAGLVHLPPKQEP